MSLPLRLNTLFSIMPHDLPRIANVLQKLQAFLSKTVDTTPRPSEVSLGIGTVTTVRDSAVKTRHLVHISGDLLDASEMSTLS